MSSPLRDLANAGVSVWLDDLSRPLIETGGLAKLVDDGEIVGITTNPTIFAKAIGAESGYEDQLRELALRGTAIGEALRLLTAWDVRAACDVLLPIFERSGGRDGRVSIEVDARISDDADRTAAEARGLWWLVDRPNIFIKIPATEAALPAITSSLADGISVNVTLIFSVKRYKAVLESFLSGLEKRKASGRSFAGIESVASFFLSRVDTETDRRLAEVEAKGGEDGAAAKRLHGLAAIANARLAYQIYEDMLDSPRWQALAASGARPQRLLWASTGVRIRPLATRDMSWIWSHRIPSIPCPQPPCRRWRTTASFVAIRFVEATMKPGIQWTNWDGWASTWPMWPRPSRVKGSRRSSRAGTNLSAR